MKYDLKSTGLFAGLMLTLALGACSTIKIPESVKSAQPKELPDNYVYLRQIDPTIRQYIRYSTNDNFMGEKIDGYKAGECVLKREAAEAVKNVQTEAKKHGYGLIVFDCYRPQKAVNHMVRWVAGGDEKKPDYFANLPRNTLIKEGYISDKSNHSKGYTIDLALVPLGKIKEHGELYGCFTRHENYTLDFGAPYDCFDASSNTFNPIVKGDAAVNRKLLVDLMAAQGYENYDMEWWHFTHKSKPKDAAASDFDIE